MRFAISTALFSPGPLRRHHLEDIALCGFSLVELVAGHGVFDPAAAGSADALAGWLEETGLRLHAVYVPLARMAGEDGKGRLSLAAREATRRSEAMRHARAALALAATLPFAQLIVPLGTADTSQAGRDDNHRESARRSLEELGDAAVAAGVHLAVESGTGPLSRADALVTTFDEHELDEVGICLDFVAGADAPGGVVDAIEETSGHLVATHLADVDRAGGPLLVPFDGSIDWAAVVFALEKIGFDDVHVLRLPPDAPASETIARARTACARLDDLSPFRVEQFIR